ANPGPGQHGLAPTSQRVVASRTSPSPAGGKTECAAVAMTSGSGKSNVSPSIGIDRGGHHDERTSPAHRNDAEACDGLSPANDARPGAGRGRQHHRGDARDPDRGDNLDGSRDQSPAVP